jgi:hypothetical protein
MNMSGSRFTQLSSMRMGWKAAIRCRVARWTNTSFRERKVLGAPKRFLEVKLAEKNGHPFGVLDRRASRLSSWSVSVRASPRPSDMAGLIGRIPWDGRVRQRRDESYLAWRFLNPRSAYRFFYHGKEDLQGYLVLEGKRRRTEMEARILDWEATTEEVAWDLLDAAVRMSGLKHLSTWANSLAPRRAEMLRASGFEEVDEEQERERAVNPAVLVKSLVDDDDAGEADPFGVDLTRELNWDVRPLYSDAG